METATATAAVTRPTQRLRMLFSFPAEAGHEVPHDFLKHGGIEPIPDELAFALGGDEVRRLQDAKVVRHRCERDRRSEEHTSELQSQSNLVCRLLLEKKKKNDSEINYIV